MNLAEALERQSNLTYTENGALALKRTKSELLDFFAVAGALRDDEDRAVKLFDAAFDEDPYMAVRALFYARDVRGGLGERKIPKILLNHLAKKHPEWVEVNLEIIPYFGRWDDLLVLLDTPLEKATYKYLREVFLKDVQALENGGNITLLAKWLPSPSSGSRNTELLGKRVAKGIITDSSEYIWYCRKLTALRKKLNLPEIAMAAKQYEDIEYSKICARAMMFHKEAFKKHDYDRFTSYIEAVSAGEAKMSADTLVPYDIVHKVRRNELGKELQLMWDNLPDYIEGDNSNILCMCDTSGSMTWNGGRPYEVAAGLGIYFAERNNGIFKNRFITFSSEPDFVVFKDGATLAQKLTTFSHAEWGGHTNIGAAMELILDAAVGANIPPEDMPRALIIISDMEFDACATSNDKTFLAVYNKKFEQKGYKLPDVIFWNVQSRNAVYHAAKNDYGVQLVSGDNPSVFRQVIDNIGRNPYDSMMATLSQKRYDVVRVPEE